MPLFIMQLGAPVSGAAAGDVAKFPDQALGCAFGQIFREFWRRRHRVVCAGARVAGVDP